jgi:ParB family chromosome partitioning protein
VREAESLVQLLLNPPQPAQAKTPDRDLLRLQEELSESVGTKVVIKPGNRGSGKLILDYTSHEHLDELIANLQKL